MKQSVSISIIIPTKNEARTLPRLLKSILGSLCLPEEVIVVDNHSTDQTSKKARKAWRTTRISQKPTLKIINQGPERSTQKNEGAKNATGSHLLFLDADMELPKKLFAELLKFAGQGVTATVIPERSVGQDFWGKAVALERNCYSGQSPLEAPRLIEKKTFSALGGFDTNLIAGEDWDLAERLKQKAVLFHRTKQHLFHHEAKGLLPNLRRKCYYTQHIIRYAQKHPHRFAQQSSLKNRILIYWHSRRKLIKNPVQATAFLLIKAIVYLRWKLSRTQI